jgi:predicted phage terminase large subunit-like protein
MLAEATTAEPEQYEMNELDLVQSICRESFYDFVQEHWPLVSAETPVWNWHISYLCNQLQRAAERVFAGEECLKDIVINIPPGTTKSTIVSEMFPAWVWTRMPHAQFICVSHTYTVAHDLARRCKQIVDSPLYQNAFRIGAFADKEIQAEVDEGTRKSPVAIKKEANSISMFINESGGFRIAMGSGTITGFHAHFILIDDPIDPEATESEAERDKAVRHCAETLPTRKVNKSVSLTILVMQRLHQADPSGLMLGQMSSRKWGGKVKHICLPATCTDKVRPVKLKRFYQPCPAGTKNEDGTPLLVLDTLRLNGRIYRSLKSILGKYGGSCQLDQDPAPREGGIIDVSKIRDAKCPPLKRFKMLVRYWDKAGTHKAGKRTAGVLMGQDDEDRFHVVNVTKGQWGTADRERNIKSTAQVDGYGILVCVEQEPGSGGKESGENTVKNLAGFRVELDKPTGDKEVRADAFAYQVDIGNVYADKSKPWYQEYQEELQYFPNGEFSDQVDGTSGSFNRLNRGNTRLGAWGRENT